MRSWFALDVNGVFAFNFLSNDYVYIGGGLEVTARFRVHRRLGLTLSLAYLPVRSLGDESNYVDSGSLRPVHHTILPRGGIAVYSKVSGILRIRHELSIGGWVEPVTGSHRWEHAPVSLFLDPIVFEVGISNRYAVVINLVSLELEGFMLPASVMARMGIKVTF